MSNSSNTKSFIHECVHSTKMSSLSKHHHTKYELIYVVKGEIKVIINDKSYIVKPNYLIFISDLEEHSVEILASEYERYYLILNNNSLDKLIKNPVLCSIFKNRPKGFSHMCPAPHNTDDLMQHIIEENYVNDNFSEDIIGLYLKQILINLYRLDTKNFPVVSMNSKPEIYAVQKYIDQNFSESIKIADLANKFFISTFYLSHAFKDLTGYSPKRYLSLVRLMHAKALLLETNASIENVSQKCGFFDSNSFARTFKEEYSTTPKQFRKNATN